MIEVGNEDKKNKNKYRWNYCHHMHMLSLLGANNCLPLFHMANILFGFNKILCAFTKCSIHTFFTCSLKVLLTLKPWLIIYPIVNSLICFFPLSPIKVYQNEIWVDDDSPPTMITYAYDDNNSICLYYFFFLFFYPTAIMSRS